MKKIIPYISIIIIILLILPITINWYHNRNCCGLGAKPTKTGLYPTSASPTISPFPFKVSFNCPKNWEFIEKNTSCQNKDNSFVIYPVDYFDSQKAIDYITGYVPGISYNIPKLIKQYNTKVSTITAQRYDFINQKHEYSSADKLSLIYLIHQDRPLVIDMSGDDTAALNQILNSLKFY